MAVDVAGEVLAPAGVEETYQALTNPEWLAASVPGIRECERIEVPSNDLACRIVWELGLSMMRVRFAGQVGWITDAPPDRLTMTIAGAGTFGELDLTVHVSLNATGPATRIIYQGQGEGPDQSPTWKSKALEPIAHLMIQKLVEALAKGAHAK